MCSPFGMPGDGNAPVQVTGEERLRSKRGMVARFFYYPFIFFTVNFAVGTLKRIEKIESHAHNESKCGIFSYCSDPSMSLIFDK